MLCEAPLAASTADGAAMVAAAQRSGRLGLLDLQSRFWPALAELRRLVAAGFLGTLENVEVRAFYPTFTRPEKVVSSLWCADATAGASTLRVHGLHSADVVRWIFGEITDVTGTAATRRPVWPAPEGPLPATSRDSMALVGRVADGAVLSMHTSWVAWHGSGWRLAAYGSEGTLVATADGHTGHFPVRLDGARGDDSALRRIEPVAGAGEVTELAADAATLPFARLVRRLAAALAEDDPAAAAATAELPTFDDGVGLLRLADAVDGGHPTAAPRSAARARRAGSGRIQRQSGGPARGAAHDLPVLGHGVGGDVVPEGVVDDPAGADRARPQQRVVGAAVRRGQQPHDVVGAVEEPVDLVDDPEVAEPGHDRVAVRGDRTRTAPSSGGCEEVSHRQTPPSRSRHCGQSSKQMLAPCIASRPPPEGTCSSRPARASGDSEIDHSSRRCAYRSTCIVQRSRLSTTSGRCRRRRRARSAPPRRPSRWRRSPASPSTRTSSAEVAGKSCATPPETMTAGAAGAGLGMRVLP